MIHRGIFINQRLSYLLSEDDIILHEDLGQCHGVLNVDIVVLGAVDQHQLARVNEVSGAGDAGAAVGLPAGVRGGQAHVALGVGGVVVVPLGHRGHGHAARQQLLLVLGHHHGRHVAAIAPAPHTHPLPVNVLDGLRQVLDHGQGVLHLVATQLTIHGMLETVALKMKRR